MKKRIITLIKFIIFVGVFYALLAFNVFHLGEKLAPTPKNYLEINIPTENENIDDVYFSEQGINTGETGHFAGMIDYAKMKENECKKIDICDKISFNGTYSSYDSFTYTKAITTLVGFLDTNGSEKTPIHKVLKKIDINKNIGQRRGYATWDSIIMNLGAVTSKREFAELLTHEMGHITDLGYIQGSTSTKDKNYTEFGKEVFSINDLSLTFYKISRNSETIRKAEAKKKDFCSGYGMSDPFEDFSECFNLYLNHNILFREMTKKNPTMEKKYNFIAAIVNGKYLASNDRELSFVKENSTRRPRDTTKISN